jgi:acetyl-CoA decarbonylase/synthase complex subunit gamma
MNYKVDPGLYALHDPGPDSPVLVTANYKLTFDALRRELAGIHAWLLVLDTAGINVWCAAGKGTFGTENLARSIAASGLARVVSHRQLIVPQLGAPGVAAHQVKRLTGFGVAFGPVAAADLPACLAAGLAAGKKVPPAMRRKGFPWRERAVLIPMELVAAMKWGLAMAVALTLLGGLGPGGYLANLTRHGLWAAGVIIAAALSGSVAGPLLLPWLPGRAFAAKGLWLGLATGAGLMALGRPGWLEGLGWLGMTMALCAFLVMNFTGASTYTSLSGVKKEMRWAAPLETALGALGLAAWLASRFLA